MSFLDSAFSFLGSEQRGVMPGQSALFNGFGLGMFGSSAAGITHKNDSLKIAAYYNGVDQISSDIARIPFKIFERKEGVTIELPNHPASQLLKNPNDLITPFIATKMTVISMINQGNALWHIVTDDRGQLLELKWIDWYDVLDIKLSNDGKTLLYFVRNYEKALLASEVLHFKGMCLNGYVGISVVHYAAEQLGLTLKTQAFSITSMDNKGVRQGVVESDKTITSTGKTSIIQGVQNAFGQKDPTRVAVLDEGLKFRAINLTAQEIQLIEQQRFNVEDIARWLNMPLHKIKSMTAATNNNIEQQAKDYVGDTLAPYVTNIEQEYAKKLLKSSEFNMFCSGNMNALMRANMVDMAEYYSKLTQSGVYSRKEAREFLGMNPGADVLAEYLTPVNTFTETQLANNIKQSNSGTNGTK